MDPNQLRTLFDARSSDPTTGTPGAAPMDWFAKTSEYGTDANGSQIDPTVARQKNRLRTSMLGTGGGVAGRLNALSHGLYNTQRFNAGSDVGDTADTLMGFARGKYTHEASEDRSIDDPYAASATS